MRRALSIALAAWFALAMTLAQSCATPAQTSTPYNNVAPSTPPVGTTSSTGSGAPETTNSVAETSTHLDTAAYTADQARSQALSDYLKQRRLPLVGAQVLQSPSGARVVVLYGYVATDHGKQDAVTKTHQYLADSSVAVDNRIKINPELLSAGNGAGGPGANSEDETAAGTTADSQYPGASSYEQQANQAQQNQAQQYVQQQNTGAALSAMAPLLMLGMMALSMGSGGTFMVNPGSFGPMGGSPFGGMGGMGGMGPLGGSPFGPPAPYNPYPGFPSPPPPPSAFGP
jgi:hypothetical protein